MLRVGVFKPEALLNGASLIVAWGPKKGTGGPGVCVAPLFSMGQPFPYELDPKSLHPNLGEHDLLGLAAEMAVNGAPFALMDAAFLVLPAWRALTVRGYVAHTANGVWNVHNPDDSDDVLHAYRCDHGMLRKRMAHDVENGLPTVEIVEGFGRR